MSNTTDPEFLAKWEPWRRRIRPVQCHLGERGVCWVKEPYKALEDQKSRYAVRCQGCGGLIGGRNSGGPIAVAPQREAGPHGD